MILSTMPMETARIAAVRFGRAPLPYCQQNQTDPGTLSWPSAFKWTISTPNRTSARFGFRAGFHFYGNGVHLAASGPPSSQGKFGENSTHLRGNTERQEVSRNLWQNPLPVCEPGWNVGPGRGTDCCTMNSDMYGTALPDGIGSWRR
jgi:hypothetical protein